MDDNERVIKQIERNNGKSPHASELEAEHQTTGDRTYVPPVGLSDELREKLAKAQNRDSAKALPFPEKQLQLER